MKRTFLLGLLLTLGVALAQTMTGGDMSGGMASGGTVTNQEISGEGASGMPVEAPVAALMQSGGMMSGGMMSGGMMSGGMMSGGMMSGGSMMGQPFEVSLSGDNEVPPVTTNATGSATAALMGDTMTLNGDFSDLSSPVVEIAGTPAHIHLGAAGENGDVIFPLNVSVDEGQTSGIFSLSTTLTQDQIDAFNAGNLYINIHTEMNQGGELRGQITPGM